MSKLDTVQTEGEQLKPWNLKGYLNLATFKILLTDIFFVQLEVVSPTFLWLGNPMVFPNQENIKFKVRGFSNNFYLNFIFQFEFFIQLLL